MRIQCTAVRLQSASSGLHARNRSYPVDSLHGNVFPTAVPLSRQAVHAMSAHISSVLCLGLLVVTQRCQARMHLQKLQWVAHQIGPDVWLCAAEHQPVQDLEWTG